MSNEKKPTNLLEEIEEASAETKAAMFKAIDAATRARHGLESADFKQKECREQHAKLEAEANRMRDVARLEAARVREKAEVEAFGHRFHAKLLAAMKAGSTNVVDMLGASMEAAGVGATRPTMPEREVGERLRDVYGGGAAVESVFASPRDVEFPGMKTGPAPGKPLAVPLVVPGGWEADVDDSRDFAVVIKGRTVAHVERALDQLKRDIAAREAPAKIAEPAPSALSVEERKWRKGVELALSAALGTEPDDLEDLLREVNRRLWRQAVPLGDAQVLVESKARDAALEEAARVLDAVAEESGFASEATSGSRYCATRIRALKSKPAPPSSASYGDFGWALQQLLAGKRVKQGDSPRSWRMREDGALVDQNGIVMRELHMDMVLAMNWRLAE